MGAICIILVMFLWARKLSSALAGKLEECVKAFSLTYSFLLLFNIEPIKLEVTLSLKVGSATKHAFKEIKTQMQSGTFGANP